ncbi:intraflagellar transport protein 74 homolog [Lycorma delicatula]|uniref:intraflagellar transport protein 74 homolog n=1 Tax=Lycorma delicatula TaxID=130591 RepID=UPI003F519475
MDRERPLSRVSSDERPVTRWKREDKPPSRRGFASNTLVSDIESRPISRREIKSVVMQESPVGLGSDQQLMRNTMRPPSSTGFTGTATRLTSAMMQQHHHLSGSRTALNLIGTQVNVRDRLVSQQGLSSSVRTSTARGLHTRQVQDKRYFESLLQLKCRDLTNEITRLNRQIETDTREQATFLVYDKRVKEMAAELTELQGKLSDYNLVVDKLNTGTEWGEIMAEARDLAAINKAESSALESLFAERTRRQAQIAQLEKEIQKERQTADNLVNEMSNSLRETYLRLQQENSSLQKEMDQLQRELDVLNATKSSLEDQLCVSPIKQEAVRLYEKLAELEQRRDMLIAEAKSRATPAQERETLLSRVREDNAEIASMERAMAELREQIRQSQLTLEQADQDLNESQGERHAKYLELRKREETMESFLSTFEENRDTEIKRLSTMENDIVEALATISRQLATLPTPADYQSIGEDIGPKSGDSGARTVASLTSEHSQLTLYLNKMEVMETKVKSELETLKNNLSRMQSEMITLSDLDKLRNEADEKRKILTVERDELKESQPDVITALNSAKNKFNQLEKELSENETHLQLSSLERKLAQLEQNNFSIREYIATCTSESDYELLKDETLHLVNNLNKSICENLRRVTSV